MGGPYPHMKLTDRASFLAMAPANWPRACESGEGGSPEIEKEKVE